MNTKQFVICAGAVVLAYMFGRKAGRAEGVHACLTKVLADNPDLEKIVYNFGENGCVSIHRNLVEILSEE